MELNNVLKKEWKSFVAKANYQQMRQFICLQHILGCCQKSYNYCNVINLIFFALCLLQIHNLEAQHAILATKKTKLDIKKELEDSIGNGMKNENTDIEQMVENCAESAEDAAKVIHEFEEIIRYKKSHIVLLA